LLKLYHSTEKITTILSVKQAKIVVILLFAVRTHIKKVDKKMEKTKRLAEIYKMCYDAKVFPLIYRRRVNDGFY